MSSSEVASAEKGVLSPEVRAILGQRLRAYYDHIRHMPVSDALAEMLRQVEDQLNAERENSAGNPSPHDPARRAS